MQIFNQFDLTLALKGKPVTTRTGELVLIVGVNYNADFPNRLFGFIGKTLHTWYVNGRKHEETTSYSDYDLFMKMDCDSEKNCCGCTCNRNQCLTDFLSGTLELRKLNP